MFYLLFRRKQQSTDRLSSYGAFRCRAQGKRIVPSKRLGFPKWRKLESWTSFTLVHYTIIIGSAVATYTSLKHLIAIITMGLVGELHHHSQKSGETQGPSSGYLNTHQLWKMTEVYNCTLIDILVGFLPFCRLDAIAPFQTDFVASIIDTTFITVEKNGWFWNFRPWFFYSDMG